MSAKGETIHIVTHDMYVTLKGDMYRDTRHVSPSQSLYDTRHVSSHPSSSHENMPQH